MKHLDRERSYWYKSVVVCVESSVSTRMTQAVKQRGSGAVGSSMARLNRAGCIEPVLARDLSAYACSHSLAVPVMTGVRS